MIDTEAVQCFVPGKGSQGRAPGLLETLQPLLPRHPRLASRRLLLGIEHAGVKLQVEQPGELGLLLQPRPARRLQQI